MPTSEWTPSVQDVANILRARTKDDNGNEVGTFNSDTRPTEAQVTGLIVQAVSDVSSSVGSDVPAPCMPDAAVLATVRAAMKVELSYFPEQLGNNRSPYNALKDEWSEGVKRLQTCIQNTNSGGTTGASGPPAPKASFPMYGDTFLLGRRTRW